MKVVFKVFILIITITLAIGGVMVYAKTRVEPPVATGSVDQYTNNLEECLDQYNYVAGTPGLEDSLFAAALNKIGIYVSESKIDAEEGDEHVDDLLSIYSSLFLDRTFRKFNQSTWYAADHDYMRAVIANLRSVRYFDGSGALKKQTADSLNIVEKVISDYNQAWTLSRKTGYSGISSAQTTIGQARAFSENQYLSHCSELVSALNELKTKIGQSHYRYASGIVNRLSEYGYYSKSYYEETLIPQAETAINDYDNNASRLYGKKENVSALRSTARDYVDRAYSYYD